MTSRNFATARPRERGWSVPALRQLMLERDDVADTCPQLAQVSNQSGRDGAGRRTIGRPPTMVWALTSRCLPVRTSLAMS